MKQNRKIFLDEKWDSTLGKATLHVLSFIQKEFKEETTKGKTVKNLKGKDIFYLMTRTCKTSALKLPYRHKKYP